MVRKIVLFSILPCMVLALLLSLIGVREVGYGDTYINFLRSVSRVYENWKLEIPSISKLTRIDTGNYDKGGVILTVLIKIANFFVNFVNVFIVVLNVLINLTNVVIGVIQFLLSFIYCIKDFLNSFRSAVVV